MAKALAMGAINKCPIAIVNYFTAMGFYLFREVPIFSNTFNTFL